MKLTKLSEECKEGTCPAVYLSDRGTLVLQGNAVRRADGLLFGQGEQAVELPIALVREAIRELGQ